MTVRRLTCEIACQMSRRRQVLLLRKRAALLDRLRSLPNVMRGNVYRRLRRCGRAGCACARDKRLGHPALQVSVSQRGRTRTRHLSPAQASVVEQWVSSYRLLWGLVEELTAVNLELLALDGAADAAEGSDG